MSSLFTHSQPRHPANCLSSWNPVTLSVAFLLAGDRPAPANQGIGMGLTGSAFGGSEQAFDGINDQLGLRKETEQRSGRYRYRDAVPKQD